VGKIVTDLDVKIVKVLGKIKELEDGK